MTRIAVLGLGAMGSRMADNLLAAGHALAVYNRTPARAEGLAARGATVADTPRAAAEGADFVLAMLTDDDASRAVWLDDETGAIHGLRRGAIAIEASTLSPAWTAELSRAVAAAGAGFLDAPVAGSRPQAEAGALIFLVGGGEASVETARPVLAPLAAAIHHVGPVGAGMAMKLAVNAFFGIQVAALGEVLALARASGIDHARAAEVLGALPITAPPLKGVAGLMVSGAHAPLFPIDLVAKDFDYIVAAAERANTPAPTSRAVRDLYARAAREGHGGDNISGIAKLFD